MGVPRRREEMCEGANEEGEGIDFPRSIMYLIWGTVHPRPEALCSIWDKPHLEAAEPFLSSRKCACPTQLSYIILQSNALPPPARPLIQILLFSSSRASYDSPPRCLRNHPRPLRPSTRLRAPATSHVRHPARGVSPKAPRALHGLCSRRQPRRSFVRPLQSIPRLRP